MSWLELSVAVDQEAAEAVSAVLSNYGYSGGVIVEPAWTPGDEGSEFSYDPTRPVTLRTYLPVDEHTAETRERIEQALWHLGQLRPIGPLQVRSLEEEDWSNAWKQHYTVQQIGARTVIVPSWLEYAPQPNDIVLHLDPGMAFGTGLHPTTQLCLQLLEQYVYAGAATLDLGTGSGILAIAAAKLGANPVLALDNDPVAVAVAQENVDRNGVGDIISAALGSLGAGQHMGHWLAGYQVTDHDASLEESQIAPDPNSFDLIVANLIAKVLAILAPDLATALAPGGTLISSGIIIDREEEVTLALAAAGLHLTERRRESEWIALVHRKT
ncbi:MAG: 50S ribosomal protein L11 methyltransferase [Chloroflexales bacterium]|nr:50S ribosomal protein L11 methyltransferase [Chloroflexales bacterium]